MWCRASPPAKLSWELLWPSVRLRPLSSRHSTSSGAFTSNSKSSRSSVSISRCSRRRSNSRRQNNRGGSLAGEAEVAPRPLGRRTAGTIATTMTAMATVATAAMATTAMATTACTLTTNTGEEGITTSMVIIITAPVHTMATTTDTKWTTITARALIGQHSTSRSPQAQKQTGVVLTRSSTNKCPRRVPRSLHRTMQASMAATWPRPARSSRRMQAARTTVQAEDLTSAVERQRLGTPC
mmetsp:Transcript_149948/g.481838  ORF Transcript_149948/g.481838 Transcript_149948/m.481838 type:complete len:239 (-) Transcript_149948:1832-2548(-)